MKNFLIENTFLNAAHHLFSFDEFMYTINTNLVASQLKNINN
jgi:hypothetical protein